MSDTRHGRPAPGLQQRLLERYARVAERPEACFPYPIGRASAEALRYPVALLDEVPARCVERFVGIGNPLRSRPPRTGERVLDLGCGAGLDTIHAARLVGGGGRVVGLDRSPAMLAHAIGTIGDEMPTRPMFVVGDAARLPCSSASFDIVTSNGALNLVFDKGAAFAELARVLRPGGTLTVADVLVVDSVPPEVLASLDAWST
jgi:SAM-dependent methyltransferase